MHGLLLVVLQAMLSAATGESRRYASETNATTQKCTAVFTEKMMKRDRPSLDALVRFGQPTRVAVNVLFALVAAQRGDATRTKLYSNASFLSKRQGEPLTLVLAQNALLRQGGRTP